MPRPIALVTTVDGEGRVNAAPFSFFNALSADPPILALGVENYGDQSPKDTTRNIQLNQEFTVNIVSDALVEAMNVCAVPFAPGFDELTAAGLTAIAGTTVKCPRIGEAPVALECRRMMALSIGQSREMIFGEVLMAHVRDELIDPKTLYIDQLGSMRSGGWAGMAMRAPGITSTCPPVLCRHGPMHQAVANDSGLLPNKQPSHLACGSEPARESG